MHPGSMGCGRGGYRPCRYPPSLDSAAAGRRLPPTRADAPRGCRRLPSSVLRLWCLPRRLQAQASIGTGAILNTGCSIDHDAQLADGVHICPGARLAGAVHVGTRSWIGIGASVIQQVRDLPDGVTAVGVPARVISSANP